MSFNFRDGDRDGFQFDGIKVQFVFFRVEGLVSLMINVFLNHEVERVKVVFSFLFYRFALQFFEII